MTEMELLDRCNLQAVRIAELEKDIETMRGLLASQPDAIRNAVLADLRRATVNCNGGTRCALAGRVSYG